MQPAHLSIASDCSWGLNWLGWVLVVPGLNFSDGPRPTSTWDRSTPPCTSSPGRSASSRSWRRRASTGRRCCDPGKRAQKRFDQRQKLGRNFGPGDSYQVGHTGRHTRLEDSLPRPVHSLQSNSFSTLDALWTTWFSFDQKAHQLQRVRLLEGMKKTSKSSNLVRPESLFNKVIVLHP